MSQIITEYMNRFFIYSYIGALCEKKKLQSEAYLVISLTFWDYLHKYTLVQFFYFLFYYLHNGMTASFTHSFY